MTTKTISLSPSRQAALDTVTKSGATRTSPFRLHGPAFKAGIWLYEHDLLGMTSAGFYPLPSASDPAAEKRCKHCGTPESILAQADPECSGNDWQDHAIKP